MVKRRRCADCPPPGSPGWMSTFADMSTLLLTFFVLLLSMSTIEVQKFTEAMTSLKGALGVLSGTGTSPIRMPQMTINRPQAEREIEQQIQNIEELMRRNDITDEFKMHQSSDVLHFSISDNFLFDSGQAVLKEGADIFLEAMAKILNTVPFNVRIEGHTDNIPIHSMRFPSNWELSYSRGLAIAERFSLHGVQPARFQIVGHGEHRPLADNASPQGRAINRRVEIYVNLREDIYRSL